MIDVALVALVGAGMLLHVREQRRWTAEYRKLTAAMLAVEHAPALAAQILAHEPKPKVDADAEPPAPRKPIGL